MSGVRSEIWVISCNACLLWRRVCGEGPIDSDGPAPRRTCVRCLRFPWCLRARFLGTAGGAVMAPGAEGSGTPFLGVCIPLCQVSAQLSRRFNR